jgi:toxin ParE1/3/4
MADADLVGILGYSTSRFGAQQRNRYAELIDKAAAMLADDPARPGSRSRDDLAPGVRSFPVERAARRRGAATHVLFYIVERHDPDGGADILVLRVLHERMDPTRHLDPDS